MDIERLNEIIIDEGIDASKPSQWDNVAKKYFDVKKTPPKKRKLALHYAYTKNIKTEPEKHTIPDLQDKPFKIYKCDFNNSNITIGCSNMLIKGEEGGDNNTDGDGEMVSSSGHNLRDLF